ncbi:hypothetical protein B0T19DRAFT_431960 [Cercophora scortea]|uniref:FAD-binding PCMH-type domain-containing protein n=1 Tax=Cercophora scortea TaxID=314031 RepID=A0AAE0M6M0_9PEZI|nr:hypothetical protein B0T19DRAFT_431960 [Cercophora scortea]
MRSTSHSCFLSIVLLCLLELGPLASQALVVDHASRVTHPERIQTRAVAACSALSDAIPGQVFWPNSTQYTKESTNVWSQACVLTPYCVFEPLTALDLSKGLGLIKQHQSPFAVRSGGHMPVPGAQSLDDGVMVSMSRFNRRSFKCGDRSVISIGPGQTWDDVYTWLSPYGLAVNGGRFPSVGVGGLLLGGGMGFFSGRQGWAVDNIVGWQLVLANGSVIEVVAADRNGPTGDLAWALKGGSNFFGIVTRFDVRTFPLTVAYGGVITWDVSAQDSFFDALTAYMAPGGGVDDPDVHVDAFAGISFTDGVPSYSYYNVPLYPGNNSAPRALENFTAIPTSSVLQSGVGVHSSWVDVARQLSPFSSQANRNLFYAISYKADARSISIANTTVMENARNELSHVRGLTTFCVWQPVSKSYLQASKDKGGNVLGLDPEVDGTFMAGIIMSMWSDAKDDETVLNFAKNAAQEIRTKTEELGLYNKFEYLNDAAEGQTPLGTYAGGESLKRLQKIRAKYDPDGFLLEYLHRGFQLS